MPPHEQATATPGDAYDLLVIGGGINGVGIARDAAGRGLSVLLCEQDDLGGATSSASSKLLHGGLRYLEQFQFRMVRHALAEREVLLASAPHIVKPLRFVLPHNRAIRPYWMLRVGVFLYDRLARRATLPDSRALDLRAGRDPSPLCPEFDRGFEYSDCWVDDARLVVLSAVDARARGAEIRTRTRCEAATWTGDGWNVALRDTGTDSTWNAQARAVINAAGPWAERVATETLGLRSSYRSKLVKGSHIVVPRLFDDERAFILQNDDKRIVFVLPFERDFTLIGTTDVPYEGDPGAVEIDAGEASYLCDIVRNHFDVSIAPEDIVWSYSGVRPLYDDGSSSASKLSRDYILEPHTGTDGALRAMTVWGGKLTGYRLLTEAALERLAATFPEMGPAWTADAKLPGGDLHPTGIERFTHMLTQVYDWLPSELATAYAGRYGALSHTVLGNGASLDSLGPELAPGLYGREVDYLMRHEWAQTADDVLWRRTKLGLWADSASIERVADYMQASQSTTSAANP